MILNIFSTGCRRFLLEHVSSIINLYQCHFDIKKSQMYNMLNEFVYVYLFVGRTQCVSDLLYLGCRCWL